MTALFSRGTRETITLMRILRHFHDLGLQCSERSQLRLCGIVKGFWRGTCACLTPAWSRSAMTDRPDRRQAWGLDRDHARKQMPPINLHRHQTLQYSIPGGASMTAVWNGLTTREAQIGSVGWITFPLLSDTYSHNADIQPMTKQAMRQSELKNKRNAVVKEINIISHSGYILDDQFKCDYKS